MEDTGHSSLSFIIDGELWEKFNLELRAACHWCTHHHTTTPAEAAKQLERGEGWPRDWISRKVKNSTRQFGGLFICPASDCPGHSNPKGERRRRWFCRFCINRHLGVDLKNFFQFDEAQGKWFQVKPTLFRKPWNPRSPPPLTTQQASSPERETETERGSLIECVLKASQLMDFTWACLSVFFFLDGCRYQVLYAGIARPVMEMQSVWIVLRSIQRRPRGQEMCFLLPYDRQVSVCQQLPVCW